MSDEDNCTDYFPPYSGGGTSEDAAEAICERAPALRKKVLDFIRSRGEYGATDQEIQHGLPMQISTQLPRRWELAREGKIKRNGQTRKTIANRNADVWVATEGSSDSTEHKGIGEASGDPDRMVSEDGRSEIPTAGNHARCPGKDA